MSLSSTFGSFQAQAFKQMSKVSILSRRVFHCELWNHEKSYQMRLLYKFVVIDSNFCIADLEISFSFFFSFQGEAIKRCQKLNVLKSLVIDSDFDHIGTEMLLSSKYAYSQVQPIKKKLKVTFASHFIFSCFEAMKTFEFAVGVQIPRYRLGFRPYRYRNVTFQHK